MKIFDDPIFPYSGFYTVTFTPLSDVYASQYRFGIKAVKSGTSRFRWKWIKTYPIHSIMHRNMQQTTRLSCPLQRRSYRI